MEAMANVILAQALAITDEYVKALTGVPGATWGPKYVEVAVKVPGRDSLAHARLGFREPWDRTWGEQEVDFRPIAENKLSQALRTGTCSRDALSSAPWHLVAGDYLSPGGVCSPDRSMAVGVSGMMGLADEAIASVLLSSMTQLFRMWAEGLREEGASRVNG